MQHLLSKIIAKAYNIRRNTNDILGHAEIICIRKAIKKQKDWRLNECELYVTMKPCKMCEEIIKESRIKKVNYLLNSNYTKINSNINIKKYNISKEYVDKLQQNMKNIFKNKR